MAADLSTGGGCLSHQTPAPIAGKVAAAETMTLRRDSSCPIRLVRARQPVGTAMVEPDAGRWAGAASLGIAGSGTSDGANVN